MNDTNEVRRSGPDVKPETGMRIQFARSSNGRPRPDPLDDPRIIVAGQFDSITLKALWDAGCYDILAQAPGYCATGPIADTKCKGAPCGKRHCEGPAPMWLYASRTHWSSDRFYCSPECRDRAAKPAATPISEAICARCHDERCARDIIDGRLLWCGDWQVGRRVRSKERPGATGEIIWIHSNGRVDVKVSAINIQRWTLSTMHEAWTLEETKAPAPWKCIMDDCTTPCAPSATLKGVSWCVVCEDKDSRRRMVERDEEIAEYRPAWKVRQRAIASLASHLEPGAASALAASGASAWRPRHHGMFYLDPIDEV